MKGSDSMKYIGNVLFIIGFLAICLGVCMADANVLLAVRVMFGGLVAMFLGWLLYDLFVEVEDDDFQEYLRHMPPEL